MPTTLGAVSFCYCRAGKLPQSLFKNIFSERTVALFCDSDTEVFSVASISRPVSLNKAQRVYRELYYYL